MLLWKSWLKTWLVKVLIFYIYVIDFIEDTGEETCPIKNSFWFGFCLVAWDFIEWTVKNQALVKKSQPSHIDLVKEEILAPDYKMKLLYKIEAPD